ncbi:MAG: putative sugar nucleotidyl transferase [Crocinitomicaceae bacterium]
MIIKFTDNEKHLSFCPLTLTRPVCDLRFGILTIQGTWQTLLEVNGTSCHFFYETEEYLTPKFENTDQFDYLIAGNFKPTSTTLSAIMAMADNSSLYVNGHWLATKGTHNGTIVEIEDPEAIWLENIWDLFQQNAAAIRIDFQLLTDNKTSAPPSNTNQILGAENLFIEPGAKIECAILNASTGPIYIGKNAEVMEGAIIRGPFALGTHATVKMGAKIYGPTTIGPECKVGGEISNSILHGYSNKGHDGFIGNSLIGEWCNLGADTNSSNLKNNYGQVKLYDFKTKTMAQTPLQFCGLLMGDHSKTGINTMLNTATTVGVSANLFGAEFPPKYIPSFSWGSNDRFVFIKALEVAENMMGRRNLDLTEDDKSILQYLYKVE